MSVATRAIRAVLFGSATALALAGAPAYAGTCTAPDLVTIHCDGDFAGPIDIGSDPDAPVIDMTLVFGGLLPSSVTPDAGLFGISVIGSGAGVLDVTNAGRITTLDGDGIYIGGTGSVAFANTGVIATSVDTGWSVQGVDINIDSDVGIVNAGSISVDAFTEGNAYALKVWSTNGDVQFDNQAGATITATALVGQAVGVDLYAYFGGIDAVNNGDIVVSSAEATARGLQVRSGNGTSALNNGSITVESGGWGANVQGMFVKSHDDEVGTWAGNSGEITVTGTGAGSVAAGIYALGVRNPGVAVFNDGLITVSNALSLAKGMEVSGNESNVYARNDGLIDVSGAVTNGISASGFRSDTQVVNNGSIVTEGAGQAIWANAYQGSVAVANAGDITMTDPTFGTIYGITAAGRNVEQYVLNSGSIDMSGARGFGIVTINAEGTAGDPFAESTVVNTGTIHVDTAVPSHNEVFSVYGGFAVGIYAGANGNAIHIANTGDISANAYTYSTLAGVAQGIAAVSTSGDVLIYNSGSISASVDSSNAYLAGTSAGITVREESGLVDIFNSGSVSSSTLSSYYSETAQVFAAGITVANDSGETVITNAAGGTVTSWAGTSLHSTAAAVGIDATTLSGGIEVANGGAVIATAVSGATDDVGYSGINAAVGIQVANPFGLTTSVLNATGASITATSNADFFGATSAFGIAIDASTGSVDLQNGGSIVASANALGHVDAGNAATAFGIQVIDSLLIDTAFLNASSGSISAIASAELFATATGVELGGLALDATSDGSISAIANASSIDGVALATGVSLQGTDIVAQFTGNGSIVATATGASGTATGLLVSGSTLSVGNAGSISAIFNGVGGSAQGALLSTDGDLVFNNSGSITATGDNATGVQLDSGSITTLSNTGTISAISSTGNGVAVRTGVSADLVWNSGTINGAVDSGDGNDSFSNTSTGLWHATGASNFGAGDDRILNAGTLHLDNATIDLGTSTTQGNSFDNTGLVLVSGNNSIDMGLANRAAFLNNGAIDFRNGVVGDTLHIIGDLGGSAVAPAIPAGLNSSVNFIPSSGSVNFDVSGASGTSDLLFVDGNVLAGTYNTVNINLVDLPTTAFTNIALIYVAGDSAASSFRLGQVNYDPNASFMTLRFNLVASIDPTNATPDVFSLGGAPGHGGDPLTPAGKEGPTLADTGTRGGAAGNAGKPAIAGDDPSKPTITGTDTGPTLGAGAGKAPVVEIDHSAVSAKALAAEGPAGLEVTGLSDSGTLAASLAPGVQSLLNSQVGTLRQRTGVIDTFRKGSVALWMRLFQDSGKVSPDHVAGNFGQGGNFDFDQRNSGIEVGADFAITDTLSVGLLVAKADGRQTLQDGAGVSRIDGDTFGGYATWIADGFYLDASYRHMSFDARMGTSSGENRTDGDADAFSLEGGYAWTVGNGFKLEPQLQYTRISVDDIDAVPGTLATFHSTGGVLSRGRLGLMGSKAYSAGSAVWTPYATLSAVREFDGKNGFDINGDFFGSTSVEGTSALVEAGLNVQAGKLAIFGGINWQDGGAVDSIVSGQLGVRYGW